MMPKTKLITEGYSISYTDHLKNLRGVKHVLPRTLKALPALSEKFTGKPQFVISKKGSLLQVIREDFKHRLGALTFSSEGDFRQLTISEWRTMTCRGVDEAYGGLPMTMHDVLSDGKITLKMGNPYRNNSWEEFYLALHCRSLGIVEAKSPVGFAFWLDDLYGVERPGRMFYKHLEGIDLAEALKTESQDTLNWAVWEIGKFFSRLVRASFYLKDPHRLGNYFFEQSPSTKVLRFLDLENMYHLENYSRAKAREMVMGFIKEAMDAGFLTKEKLGEFKIVCGCFD